MKTTFIQHLIGKYSCKDENSGGGKVILFIVAFHGVQRLTGRKFRKVSSNLRAVRMIQQNMKE